MSPARPPVRGAAHEALPVDSTAADALRRVLAVEVDSVDRSTLYHVRIAVHSTSSRIPVAVVPGTPMSNLSKDAVIVARRFAAFRQLRDDVYYAAQAGHVAGEGPARSCIFCASIVDAVLLDQMQPHRYDEWVRSSETVCRRLAQFLHDLVGRARGDTAVTSTVRPRCVVQAHVQSLVVQFLELDAQDTDA